MFNSVKSYFRFLSYVAVTIIVTYYMPAPVGYIWYLMLLFLYWRSEDEPFWLAFFMTTVDGFAGFMGLYEVTLKLLPGLPGIELAQFYILISAIKAVRKNVKPYLFYNKYLRILFWYLIFLIIWGQFMGFSGTIRDYLRTVKLTVPFLLLYSLPRLFSDINAYRHFFGFVFLVFLIGFITQLFTLVTGLIPVKILELTAEQIAEAGGYEGRYRGFYNVGATLISLFGALFLLSLKESGQSKRVFLYVVIVATFGMAYTSATRGWILGFSFIIILTTFFAMGLNRKGTFVFILVSILIIMISLTNNKLRKQIDFATERVKTIESIARGDVSGEGNVGRLTVRSPRVMKIWKESPVFGWGFSDVQRRYNDGHVGNQNLLMFSGLVGFILFNGFLFFFSYKMLKKYFTTSFDKEAYLVFVIFLSGWFILHSTSGQHFNYMAIPAQIIPQAVFFSLGALMYSKAKRSVYG